MDTLLARVASDLNIWGVVELRFQFKSGVLRAGMKLRLFYQTKYTGGLKDIVVLNHPLDLKSMAQ